MSIDGLNIDGLGDAVIERILTETRRIALVGASAKPWRASNEVMGFLLRQGYDVTPVNPNLAGQTLHGRLVVPSLDEAGPVEMVDLFRASANVAPAVDAAIRLHAKVVWMQLGVIDEAAARKARAAGITVVMDRCPVIEAGRLGLVRK
jgi:predicted CoA-binding protein